MTHRETLKRCANQAKLFYIICRFLRRIYVFEMNIRYRNKVINLMKDKFQMVNTTIPSFALPNSRGQTVNIEEFQGENNVVVVLLRDIH